MKKVVALLFIFTCTIFSAVFITACSDEEFNDLRFFSSTVTYDGAEHILEVTGLPIGADVSYEDNKGTDAGVYNAKAVITKDSICIEVFATLTIEKADLMVEGIFSSKTVVYDGSEHEIALSVDDERAVYTNNRGKNAGEYQAEAFIEGDGNYNELRLFATLTIKPAQITDVLFESKTYVYDGTKKELEIEGNVESVTYSKNMGINSGVYEATARVSKGSNYEDKILYATLTILKAEYPGVILFEDKTAAYDGGEHFLEVLGLPDWAEVTYQGNGKTEIGEYEVTAEVDFGSNYQKAVLTATLNITRELMKFKDIVFIDTEFNYDGTEKVVTASNLPEGANVIYTDNSRTERGSQTAKAAVSKEGYEDLTLSATLTVKNPLVIVTAPSHEITRYYSHPELSCTLYNPLTDEMYIVPDGGYVPGFDGFLNISCDYDGRAGNFEIIPYGLDSDDYDIYYKHGSLKVKELLTGLPVGGLQVSPSGVVTLSEREFHAMGLNYYSLINSAYRTTGIYDDYISLYSLNKLKEYDVRVIRFNSLVYYAEEYTYYLNNKAEYFRVMDRLMDRCAELGIGLIPSFFWTRHFNTLYGESFRTAFENPKSNNSKSLKFIVEYTTEMVERYKGHPALFAWEFGNEWNLMTDTSSNPDDPTLRVHTELIEYWGKLVASLDPYGRMITTGDADYRTNAYNKYMGNNGTDTKEEHILAVELFTPRPLDTISIHSYGWYNNGEDYKTIPDYFGANSWEKRMKLLMEIGGRLNRAAIMGECGIIGKHDIALQTAVYDEIGRTAVEAGVPITMYWNYDPLTNILPTDEEERGTGIEHSWNENLPKGRAVLEAIRKWNAGFDEKYGR